MQVTETLGLLIFDIPELGKISADAPISWIDGISEISKYDGLQAGLWIINMHKDKSELRNAVLNLLKYGARTLNIGDANIKTFEDAANAWNNCKINKKLPITLKLCLNARTYLSAIDHNRV